MASTIIIKNGAGSSVPSSLKQGELAINVDNGKLFYGTSGSSNAVSSSFSFQHITASGDISSSGGMIIGRDMTLSTNGVGAFSVISNGVVSASGLIQGTAFKQENNGNLTFVVDTSGNVSSSGTLSGTALTLATNGVTKASIDASGNVSANSISTEGDIQHVGDTNNKISFGTDTQDFQTGGSSRLDISDSGVRLGGANSRVTTILDEDNMASDSATSLATQQSIKAYVDANAGGSVSGNTFATDLKIGRDADNLLDFTTDNQVTFRVSANDGVVMKASGEIEATSLDVSGDISSSSTLLGRALTLATNGINALTIGTDGALSASSTLAGTALTLATAGTQKASISADGSASFAGGIDTFYDATASLGYISASQLIIQGTDHSAGIHLYDNDGNNIAALARVGSGGNAHVGRMVLRDNANVKVDIRASGTSYIMGAFSSSGAIEANSFNITNNGDNVFNISNAGAISASSTIQGTAFTAQTNGTTKATIDASGNISASGTITTSTLIGNGTDTILASDGKISASGALLGNTAQFANNGINTLDISNAGAISASSTIQGTAFTAQTNGATKATIDASGNVAAEGYVSSSGQLSGTNLTLATNGAVRSTIDASGNLFAGGDISSSATLLGTDIELKSAGVHKASIDTSGNIAAEGAISSSGKLSGTDIDLRTNGAQVFAVNTDGIVNAEGGISSSGELHGNSIALTNNGDNVFSVSNAGAVSASGELAGGSLVLKQNGLDRASIDSSGDFTCRTISGSGQLIANTAQFKHNGIDTLNISNAGAISASSTIQGTALTLQDAGINTLTVDTVGNVSSSATGSFRALTIADDGVTQAAIDAEGGITGSKFQGTQHLLHTGTIYINDDPFVQNSVYLGNSTGNQPRNWNDPQASGGTLGTQTTINISEDDTRWGMLLPCDVSQVEIQCSVRPGGACSNDNFFVGLYTAARPNDGGANYDITLVAHNDSTFQQGKYTTNDFTYTGNLDKGSLIFVGIGSEDATAAKNAPGLLNVIITQR